MLYVKPEVSVIKNRDESIQRRLVCFEQHQAVRRHSAAWAETLRYRKAEFEAMGGLRRLTLDENILIGDRGVTSLAQELAEDLWVKGQRACFSHLWDKSVTNVRVDVGDVSFVSVLPL